MNRISLQALRADPGELDERVNSIRQRLVDISRHLKGVGAVVESLNKGAADRLEVAVHAIEAIADDLNSIGIASGLPGTSIRDGLQQR